MDCLNQQTRIHENGFNQEDARWQLPFGRAQWVSQHTAKTGEGDFHHVAIRELHPVAETQGARAKK